ncbi:hypothetical protein BH23GEM9_BH23GEM9_18320 [soil metagenome]
MLVAALLAAACGQEVPTGVGAGLLPPDAVRTFEVILEPDRYLVYDTAFGQYTDPQDAPFIVVANQFEGGLNSNALVRFSIPASVTVTDATGVVRLDTVPNYFAGTVRMGIDSTLAPTAAVRLALYRAGEDWHGSATWTQRVDSGGVSLTWSVPGGTRGALVDTVTVAAGADSIVFNVDSATIALWADTSNASRGAIIVAETPGTRLRTSLPALFLEARPSVRPDTVATTIAAAPVHTWLFDPEPPLSVGIPQVGGTPAWRTVFRLRERLDTLSFPCPGVPNCRARLGDSHINYAAIRLQPRAMTSGFRPEAPITVAAYLMLPTEQLPLQRSPLGDLSGFVTIPASSFAAPAGPVVEIAMTDMIRVASLNPDDRGTGFLPTHFALVPGEPRTFGYGVFEPMPALRLVISIAKELLLP